MDGWTDRQMDGEVITHPGVFGIKDLAFTLAALAS